MSNLDVHPIPTECGGRGEVSAEPVRELLTARTVQLTEDTKVRRLLPGLHRRMVGAWCFVDQYGPDDISDEPGMQVAPHPHMGLQTVSWLHDGEILHRDSLGSECTIRPYQLALMTAGTAIAHAEQSPADHPAILHGAQLWVALPDEHRDTAPRFEHHPDLPIVGAAGLRATVIMGELAGTRSPGAAFTPLVARTSSCRWSGISSTRCWACPGRPRWTACRCRPDQCSTSAAAVPACGCARTRTAG